MGVGVVMFSVEMDTLNAEGLDSKSTVLYPCKMHIVGIITGDSEFFLFA